MATSLKLLYLRSKKINVLDSLNYIYKVVFKNLSKFLLTSGNMQVQLRLKFVDYPHIFVLWISRLRPASLCSTTLLWSSTNQEQTCYKNIIDAEKLQTWLPNSYGWISFNWEMSVERFCIWRVQRSALKTHVLSKVTAESDGHHSAFWHI